MVFVLLYVVVTWGQDDLENFAELKFAQLLAVEPSLSRWGMIAFTKPGVFGTSRQFFLDGSYSKPFVSTMLARAPMSSDGTYT